MWKILALLLAPYIFALLLGLPKRESAQIEIHRKELVFGPCSGTRTRVTFRKRPRARDAPAFKVHPLPVRGWKRIELPGLTIETNLSEREAGSFAAIAWFGLRFLRSELGSTAPIRIRAFNSERLHRQYARYVKAPGGHSFFDATRGEIVVHRVNTWALVSNAMHQAAHVLGADEETAERAAALHFDGTEVQWPRLDR